MCACDGHICYVSFLFLESQELFFLIYFFVLVISDSNADACKWAAVQMITYYSYY